jgi:hypothetical protein
MDQMQRHPERDEYRVVKELQNLGVAERWEVEKELSETIPSQLSAVLTATQSETVCFVDDGGNMNDSHEFP